MNFGSGSVYFNPIPYIQKAYTLARQPFTTPENSSSNSSQGSGSGSGSSNNWFISLEQQMLSQYQQNRSNTPSTDPSGLDTTA